MDVTRSMLVLVISKVKLVMAWRLIQYVGLVLFLAIVPRTMGPDLYGLFAVFLSFISMFTIASGLGARPMFGRFVPQYEAQGEKAKTQAFFMQLFCLRALVVGLLSVVFLFLFPLLLPEASPLAVMAGAGAFLFGALSGTCYSFLYGLNALGKWLSKESLNKVLLLMLLIILGGLHSLDRASLALFVTELGFFLAGLFLTRHYLILNRSAFEFSFLFSHLRFGLLFSAANVLLMTVWRSGEVVVMFFSGQSAEVAFFNIANSIALAFYALITRLAVMITPSLTTLYVSGKKEKMDTSMGYMLKYLTIATFIFLFTVHILGAWVVAGVIGEQYPSVVVNLKILALGLLPLGLIRTSISMATVHKQPGKVLKVTAGALVTFILAVTVLVPHAGSYGASGAVALALGMAAVIAYYQFPLAPVLKVARFWRLIILGLLTLGVLVFPSPPLIPVGIIATILYVWLLFWGKVVCISEIRQIGKALVT